MISAENLGEKQVPRFVYMEMVAILVFTALTIRN